MRRAELFQDAVVVVFINFPLIVDSEEHVVCGGKHQKDALMFSSMVY